MPPARPVPYKTNRDRRAHGAVITGRSGHHHSDTTPNPSPSAVSGKHIEPTDRLYKYKGFVREKWPPRHSYLVLDPNFRNTHDMTGREKHRELSKETEDLFKEEKKLSLFWGKKISMTICFVLSFDFGGRCGPR